MAVILVESGPSRGRRIPLPGEGVVTIGRDAGCPIRLTDALVSRVHCVLRSRGDDWFLEDRQSSNRTFVNDQPVHRKRLASGDVIRIGESLLSFQGEEETSLIGATVGGYRIEERIGGGAVGVVFRAVQLSLERTVALKILAPRFARDEKFVEAFLREARAAARLNHPNVVQIHDAGRDGESYYISMEYLEGGSLEDLLEKEGRVDPSTAVALGIDAARALVYAEHNLIVHCDIKPANLLFAADGALKLADLGIARDLQPGGSGDGGSTAGSPRYMAPEQILGEEVDHRADIYALGCTLYRALAGTAPFEGSSVKEVLGAKLESDPPPLSRRDPGIPAALSDVVQRMLARSPEDRYPDARGVEAALESALRVRAQPAPRRRRRSALPRRSTVIARRFAATVAAIVFLGAVALVIKHFPTGGSGERRDPSLSSTPAARGGEGARRPGVAPSPRGGSNTPGGDEQPRARRGGTGRLSLGDDLPDEEPKPPDRRERTAALAAALEEEVRALLDEGRLHQASAALDAFEEAHRPPADLLAESRKSVEQSVVASIDDLSRRLESLGAGKRFDEARRTLDELASELPESAAPRLGELRRDVEKRESLDTSRAELLARTTSRVHQGIAALDFERAEKYLARLDGPLAAQAPIARQFRLSRDAWSALLGALGGMAESRETLELAPEGAAPRKQRLAAVRGDTVRLVESPGHGKDAHVTRAVLSLGTQRLLGILESKGGLSGAEIRAGIGLLLFLARHDEEGRALLLEAGTESLLGEPAEAVVERADSTWLRGRLKSARRLYREWEDAPAEAGADGWEYLTGEAAAIIAAGRERDDFDDVRRDLESLYVKSLAESLLLRPRESYFRARKVKFEKRVVTLTYDFATEEEIEDFHAVRGRRSSVEWLKSARALRLRGERRLLEGAPFQGRLAVRGWAPVKGFPEEAPNLNVALWTRDEDVVTKRDLGVFELDKTVDSSEEVPADYIVLAHGYRLRTNVRTTSSSRYDYDDDLPKYLSRPTFAILSGVRGKSLHGFPLRELVWEMPIGNTFRRSARFAVLMADGKLQWAVNGRTLPFERAYPVEWFARQAPRKGSVTFFTNRSSVAYSKIEVVGELRPEWFREVSLAQAQ
ncbi:MAG: protein kinase, partial [Planctomycetota bacterium]|nr:protein kinase [Planctomycetota bacterium]